MAVEGFGSRSVHRQGPDQSGNLELDLDRKLDLKIESGGEQTAALGRAEVQRHNQRRWTEQVADELVELEQDARRLAKNLLGAPTQKPITPPSAVQATGGPAEGVRASISRSSIPKAPVAEGRLAHYGAREQTPVQGRERKLFGPPPEQKIAHRPHGAHSPTSRAIAVT